jgi:hypothetical protein
MSEYKFITNPYEEEIVRMVTKYYHIQNIKNLRKLLY